MSGTGVVERQSNQQVAVVDKFKSIISSDKMKENLERALGNNKDAFAASMIELFSGDKNLQKCDPMKVAMEAFKAATLKLPISKSLGFAYVVPYKDVPTFIIGYKGLIQLALRTGQYKYINAGPVYEGEFKSRNKLSGAVDIVDGKSSDKIVGYFGYIELINGFNKTEYWTKDEVESHGKKYSPSYSSQYSPWQKNFDEMAIKTVLRHLIQRYGIMSIEMATALESESESNAYGEAEQNANSQTIDLDMTSYTESEPDADGVITGEIEAPEKKENPFA